MISVDIISKIVNKSTGKSATMVGGESNIDLSAFLLKEVWDSVWEIRQDTSGQKYIYGKLPVVTQYGVTMYADNETLDIPSIYDGLPIDNSTLVWKEGVLMVNPDIELGGASSWDELEGKPSWIGASKPVYQYSEIKNTPDLSKYVSSDELKKFVTLDGNETITGEKNFTGGLKVNGIPIDKSQDDVLYIDGNLVVRGGVTMYGENEVDIPTLMDAIAVDATMYNEGGILGVVKASTTKAGAAMFDSNFFSVDANGLVTLTNAPSSVSTLGSLLNVDVSLDSTATVNRVLYQAAGSSTWTWKELTSSGVTGDYLPLSGGTITSSSNHVLGLDTSIPDGIYMSISLRGEGKGSMGYTGIYGIYLYNTQTGGFIKLLDENAVILNKEIYIADGAVGINRNTQYGGRFNNTYNGWQFHVDRTTNNLCCYTEGTNSGMKFVVDVNGNGLFYGGITMYSDIRKKQKLQDVELSLSQIANAPLIEHYYLSDQDKTTHVGSIAQYWAELNNWFCKLDNEGFYTMEIQNAALASAISIARHLERYESKTDKKIRQLKKRISQLEDKIEKLEGA